MFVNTVDISNYYIFGFLCLNVLFLRENQIPFGLHAAAHGFYSVEFVFFSILL